MTPSVPVVFPLHTVVWKSILESQEALKNKK